MRPVHLWLGICEASADKFGVTLLRSMISDLYGAVNV